MSRPARPALAGVSSLVMSLRGRFMVALLGISLFSLAVAGFVTWSLERGRLDDRVDAELVRREEDLGALAQRGYDPLTGQRFTSVESLLRASMQSSIPAPNEGMVALVDGDVALTASSPVRIRLEDNPTLIGAARSQNARVVQTSRGPQGTYRYVVVPVSLPDDPHRGALVAAYDLGAERRQLDANYGKYAVVGSGTAVLAGLLAWLALGRVVAPIGWLRRTASQITEEDLSRRVPVRGDDDLAQLTRTINAMLDRLEATFAAQRQLYDDVGHELRTPLTVMRGHLELMDVDDPADTAHTRTIALSEVDRMAALVEDLITIAKSGRPDFVTPVLVDVGALTDEVLEKATALGQRRWTLDELAEGEAVLDPRRTSQALLELARNAVKFSAEGSVVAIGSRTTADRVRLWVRDHGRGIPPDKLAAVTERFTRLDSGTEGSGLGLTIVGSIASAQGGRLVIDSVPGEGSTFTLDLPRKQGMITDPTPSHPVTADHEVPA